MKRVEKLFNVLLSMGEKDFVELGFFANYVYLDIVIRRKEAFSLEFIGREPFSVEVNGITLKYCLFLLAPYIVSFRGISVVRNVKGIDEENVYTKISLFERASSGYNEANTIGRNGVLEENRIEEIKRFLTKIGVKKLVYDETNDIIVKNCDFELFQKLWDDKNVGSLVASHIFLGCYNNNISMTKLLDVWSRFREMLTHIRYSFQGDPPFYVLYRKLYNENACSYMDNQRNFLIDLYENGKLNCESGSILAFLLNRMFGKLKTVLVSTKNHMFLYFYENEEKMFESTRVDSMLKERKVENLLFQMTSEQVIALFNLIYIEATRNKKIWNLSLMFGIVNKNFFDFVMNTQKPTFESEMDIDVFVFLLYLYYMYNYRMTSLQDLVSTFLSCRLRKPETMRRDYFSGFVPNSVQQENYMKELAKRLQKTMKPMNFTGWGIYEPWEDTSLLVRSNSRFKSMRDEENEVLSEGTNAIQRSKIF